jgi:hypothetical protein
VKPFFDNFFDIFFGSFSSFLFDLFFAWMSVEGLVGSLEGPSKKLVLEGPHILLRPVDPDADDVELFESSHGTPEREGCHFDVLILILWYSHLEISLGWSLQRFL